MAETFCLACDLHARCIFQYAFFHCEFTSFSLICFVVELDMRMMGLHIHFQAKNWQKALELYEDIKSITLKPTVSTMNALITALCMCNIY